MSIRQAWTWASRNSISGETLAYFNIYYCGVQQMLWLGPVEEETKRFCKEASALGLRPDDFIIHYYDGGQRKAWGFNSQRYQQFWTACRTWLRNDSLDTFLLYWALTDGDL